MDYFLSWRCKNIGLQNFQYVSSFGFIDNHMVNREYLLNEVGTYTPLRVLARGLTSTTFVAISINVVGVISPPAQTAEDYEY